MGSGKENYTNRTKIPEYLQPLPRIKFEVFRKFRLHYKSPNSLVELCCGVLENKQLLRENCSAGDWPTLVDVLSVSSQIFTDSYSRLCHIDNPGKATAYVVARAKARNMTPCAYLRTLKIIRDESTHGVRAQLPQNHWNRIPPTIPAFPRVVIGKLPSRSQ